MHVFKGFELYTICRYIHFFRRKSLTSQKFRDFFNQYWGLRLPEETLAEIDWDTWFHQPGMPPSLPTPVMDKITVRARAMKPCTTDIYLYIMSARMSDDLSTHAPVVPLWRPIYNAPLPDRKAKN